MMNEETMRGKWNEIKGEIISQWGKMTDDELNQSKGNLTSIAGLIQQRYGAKKEEVEQKLDSILEKFADKFADKTEETKKRMREDTRH